MGDRRYFFVWEYLDGQRDARRRSEGRKVQNCAKGSSFDATLHPYDMLYLEHASFLGHFLQTTEVSCTSALFLRGKDSGAETPDLACRGSIHDEGLVLLCCINAILCYVNSNSSSQCSFFHIDGRNEAFCRKESNSLDFSITCALKCLRQ